MSGVGRLDVEQARSRIAGRVRRTPVIELTVGGGAVTAKLDWEGR